MYDMYHWDSSVPATEDTGNTSPAPARANRPAAAAQAPWIWRGSMALFAVSFVVQIASLAFWLPLEIYQMETLGHPTFVIALRFKNIAAFILGKMDAWGLNTDELSQDPWDYVHITT